MEDVTLGNLMHLICENLPEDWEFTLSLRAGEIDMELIDPAGNRVERCQDDMTFNDMLLDYLNFARTSDGLGHVDIRGQACDGPGPTDEQYRRAIEGDDIECPTCKGSGHDPVNDEECDTCGGDGMVLFEPYGRAKGAANG